DKTLLDDYVRAVRSYAELFPEVKSLGDRKSFAEAAQLILTRQRPAGEAMPRAMKALEESLRKHMEQSIEEIQVLNGQSRLIQAGIFAAILIMVGGTWLLIRGMVNQLSR